jgi:methylglutamate dehydrogenase subunit A
MEAARPGGLGASAPLTMAGRIPESTSVLVVGAGVHGLSTAWRLAERGVEVTVVDKTDVAAGASGIACGVIRNNYFQPAMSELMAANVEVWESDPAAFHYHPVGYVALGPEAQRPDLEEVYVRHQAIGYESELHLGAAEVEKHMRSLFPDWRATGLEVCLHEHRGGFAFNRESMEGLAAKALAAGARIVSGVRVEGFELDSSDAVRRVRTDAGEIEVEQVVVAVGPWVAELWEMLELPRRLDVRGANGELASDREMWTYWYLQEGEIDVNPAIFVTADGAMAPVLHVDSHEPLFDEEGALVTDEPWGVYFKPDRHSIQGGAAPIPQGHSFEVDPYPTGSVDEGFPRMWSSALSHCLDRFSGAEELYVQTRSGGVGAFTVDNFPVFDYMRSNVYVAADSNHGYKMIAVGHEIARVLCGEHSSLLHPFRFERFASGDMHPVSQSPYPWS